MFKYNISDNDFHTEIIAVGGGKGGVGKSIIAANIAIGLALEGERVIIVDADLGAANLHAILGIKSPPLGLKDFIFDGFPLKAVLIDTGVKNLKFISGAGDIPGISNIPFQVKQKLIHHIKSLTADYIVMDLAPGVSYNAIDFFNITDNGILVTTPEVTSVINTYSYIKGTVYRRLINSFKDNGEIRELIEVSKFPDNRFGIHNLRNLKYRLGKFDDAYMDTMDNVVNNFRPKLIVNKVMRARDINVAENIKMLVKKNLGIEVEVLGYVPESEVVKKSVANMKPFIISAPYDKASISVKEIVSKLSNLKFYMERSSESASPQNSECLGAYHG
ncbi:MAG: P-loop NTPase [Nitrospinae bacterium]|nr:P-loop NTPase [Nitrospinota bacterium]MBI3815635.1 P-loop NTPase [Nitrospinota bacterium]